MVMSVQRSIVVAGFVLLHGVAAANILSFVGPLIGTTNGGHVFPGASLPFSMAKAGADVNVENQGMLQVTCDIAYADSISKVDSRLEMSLATLPVSRICMTAELEE